MMHLKVKTSFQMSKTGDLNTAGPGGGSEVHLLCITVLANAARGLAHIRQALYQ